MAKSSRSPIPNRFRRSRRSWNSAGARRPRAAVRGDAARRRADQPHQERSAARARGSPRDVAHRRLHAAGREARPAVAGTGGSRAAAAPRPRRRPPGRRSPTAEAPTAARLARHAPRAALPRPAGVEMQLDGNPAAVVDLSTVGAQVISPTVLRPNQKVRITHSDRRLHDALPRRGRLGQVRAAQGAGRSRRNTAPASSSPTPTPKAIDDLLREIQALGPQRIRPNHAAATESSRMIVSSRAEPVDTIAAGTPVSSSSRAM